MDIFKMDGANEPDPLEDGGNMTGLDNGPSSPSSPSNGGYGGSGADGGECIDSIFLSVIAGGIC